MDTSPFSTNMLSSDDGLCKQHGLYEILQIDNFIIVWAEGPWNIEAVKNYHKCMLKALKNLNNKPFYYISIVKGESLFTPEAGELFDTVCKELSDHHVQASAFLINQSFAPISTHNLFEQACKKRGINFSSYTCEQSFKDQLLAFNNAISINDVLTAPDWWE